MSCGPSCSGRRAVSAPEPDTVSAERAAADVALMVMAQRIAALERRVLVLEAELARVARIAGG